MGDRWKPEWPTQTIGRLEWRDAPEEAPPKKQVDPVDEARLVIAAHLDIQSDWLSLASLKSHCRGQDLSERAIDAARKALVGDELVVETTVLGRPADGKYLASSQHAEAWGRPQGPAEPATEDEMMF